MELLEIIYCVIKLLIDTFIQVTPIVLQLTDFKLILVAGLLGVPVIVIKIIKFLFNMLLKKINIQI